MPSSSAPRIALAPDSAPAWMAEAITEGGGLVSPLADAHALVWGAPAKPAELVDLLERAPHLEWIQLPWAGIEPYVGVIDDDRIWTCAKGVYAAPVAELALTLGLCGLRGLSTYARASQWEPPSGANLQGARVTIIGGGGITEVLLSMLAPFDAHITVVRNRVRPMDGADVVVESEQLHNTLPGADLVVLALALTPDTEGLIGEGELRMMEPHAWLVNVARGRHVVTDDLVAALRAGEIGGAGLDVTEPEPLPAGHPLWTLPNCIITPHVGNTPDMAKPLLAERITANVRRWAHGDPLIGSVDPSLGY
jgi:phosphoglycerate dehydrogenase-like enzyme